MYTCMYVYVGCVSMCTRWPKGVHAGRKESNEQRESNRKKKDCYLKLSLSRNLDSKCVLTAGCLVRVRGPVGRAREDERAMRWEVHMSKIQEYTRMKMPLY